MVRAIFTALFAAASCADLTVGFVPSVFHGGRLATAKPANYGASVVMNAAEEAYVPDMLRRQTLNLILASSAGVTVLGLAIPYVALFLPKTADSGGSSSSIVARDALGQEVTAEGWLATHLPGSRELVEGLKGDATYVTVDQDKHIEDLGIVAVCTHMGCVVPWNAAQNKFICPCHASQYDSKGKVIRGPAPLSLALSHVETGSGKVVLKPWTEEDFRTGVAPWWK